jgi:hypothetical protein
VLKPHSETALLRQPQHAEGGKVAPGALQQQVAAQGDSVVLCGVAHSQVVELKAELKKRDLSQAGVKAVLAARLTEAVEAEEKVGCKNAAHPASLTAFNTVTCLETSMLDCNNQLPQQTTGQHCRTVLYPALADAVLVACVVTLQHY